MFGKKKKQLIVTPITEAPPVKAIRTPEKYTKLAQAFESDIIDNAIKTRNLALIFGVVCFGLMALAIIAALVTIFTDKQSPPYLIELDKSTGNAQVMRSITDTQDKYDVVVDKYWLTKYVQYRAGYDWLSIGDFSGAVELMSLPVVATEYMRDIRLPTAPVAIMKDKARISAKVVSITFIGNTAQVRYTTEKLSPSGDNTDSSPVQRWIATINYRYRSGLMTEQQRLVNPLGFKVSSWRVEPEAM